MNKGAHDGVALTNEQRPAFHWLGAPSLKRVIDALENAEAGSARFVGGCIRDSLLAATPKDFDIATTLEPEAVIDALNQAGLRAAPTGIEHGTITAIVDHQGVEVTTLRADVSTDGRRATVAFTKDWSVDAGRRDFTINAIYLSPDGRLFDPVCGVADAAARCVRFIGDAAGRIREDYLRILRFFRFSARFSESFDTAGLAACAELKDGMSQLSAERIGAEMMNIFSLPRATFALAAMQDTGVLEKIWPGEADITAVDRLKAAEPAASAPLVLAALYGERGDGLGTRLRLSNAEKALRSNALSGAAKIQPALDKQAARAMIYRLGKDVFADSIAAACAFQEIDENDYRRLKEIVDVWSPPVLGVSGRHIIEQGIAAGPVVATILQATEEQWIAEAFPDEMRVKAILSSQIARHRN